MSRGNGATARQYRDNASDWRWRVQAANGRIQGDSGEGYRRKAAMIKGAIAVGLALLRRYAPQYLLPEHRDPIVATGGRRTN